MSRAVPRWQWALFAVGTAIALYLTLTHYTARVPLACSSTGLVNCEEVLTSPQSTWLGLPVALYGLAWFLALGVWWRLGIGALRLVWTALGAVVVIYLVYLEFWVIGAICIWCSALHAVILTLFAVEWAKVGQS